MLVFQDTSCLYEMSKCVGKYLIVTRDVANVTVPFSISNFTLKIEIRSRWLDAGFQVSNHKLSLWL